MSLMGLLSSGRVLTRYNSLAGLQWQRFATAATARSGAPVNNRRADSKSSVNRRRRRKNPRPIEREIVDVTVPGAGLTVKQLSALSGRSADFIVGATKDLEAGFVGGAESQLSPVLVELVSDAIDAPLKLKHQAQPLAIHSRRAAADLPAGWDKLPLRTPVVTIMGHVDVGKTTLLDSLRRSNVAAQEAGGITQSIGAFRVTLARPGAAGGGGAAEDTITFIDTPGHEAFSSMRAHGAEATDVAIIVVAADDGVMPQTIEAVQHARAAGVPIVVAINKCDREGADPDRVRYQLLELARVNTEQLGGDIQCVEISAKTGLNLDSLLESVLLQADLLDLRADPSAPAEAVCLESKVDRHRGNVATVLLRWGRLKVGDFFVYSSLTETSGEVYGRVRAMFDTDGKAVREARAGDAVAIAGGKGVVPPGAEVVGVAEERVARALSGEIVSRNLSALSTPDLVAYMELKAAQEAAKAEASCDGSAGAPRPSVVSATAGSSALESDVDASDAVDEEADEISVPTVNVVVKADVQGSADAVAHCITRLSTVQCPVKVLYVGVGDVVDADVAFVSATRKVKENRDDPLVVAFNVKVPATVKTAARRNTVDVLQHKLIYKLEEELIERNKRMIESRQDKETIVGVAGILKVFEDGAIAGCRVQQGALQVGLLARVWRYPENDATGMNRKMVHEDSVASIKHFAKDVRSVGKGGECGIGFAEWKGFVAGDVLECVEIERAGDASSSKGKKGKKK